FIHRCERISRTERAKALKRSRGPVAARSAMLSNTRWRSYNALSVPANSIGPHPYWLRSFAILSNPVDVADSIALFVTILEFPSFKVETSLYMKTDPVR